jgi:Flp pilus assembly protein TadG
MTQSIHRSLARDERGASIVELALFAPFLGTLMLGMVDLGQGLSARHDLQQAASRAMELANSRVVTADPDTGLPDYEFLREEAADAAGVSVDKVALTQWRECNGAVQTTYNAVCEPDADGNAQEVARYVRIRITTTYTPSFRYGPIALSSAATSDGRVPMVAEAAVRIQ